MSFGNNELWSDLFTENAAGDDGCGAGADGRTDRETAPLGVHVADDLCVVARGYHQPDARGVQRKRGHAAHDVAAGLCAGTCGCGAVPDAVGGL